MAAAIVVLFVAVLGALARTLVPYLETLRDNPEMPFDRKFLVPPIVSCVIALITLPLALGALPKELMESAALSTSGLVAVFLAVWGATDVVRSGQKVLSAMFISTGKEKGFEKCGLPPAIGVRHAAEFMIDSIQ